MSEDAPLGATVGVIVSSQDADGEALWYDLLDDAGGLFLIDATSGVITLAAELDFESASQHVIVVQASDGRWLSSSRSFVIQVTNVDDMGPGPVTDVDSAPNVVREDANGDTLVGLAALSVDPDGDTVRYALAETELPFRIEAETGVVSVTGALDYESVGSYVITVLATSTYRSTSATFLIAVQGINDNTPSVPVDVDERVNVVSENAPLGATVGVIVSSQDADGETLWYVLLDDGGGLVHIDATSGVITLAAKLDFESATTHAVHVMVSDGLWTSSSWMQIAIADVEEDQVRLFVTRFYAQCLQRLPDMAGLMNWVSALKERTLDGVGVAQGFVLSQEMHNRNLNDSEYLDVLYRAFFDREPDAEGKANWLEALRLKVLREDVLYGFVRSQEFANLCSRYGITQTSTDGERTYQVRQFVRRFYQECLSREPDAEGITNWTTALIKGQQQGAGVANGFALSQEFINRDLDNDQFLNVLYKAFFDRMPDSVGLENWKRFLADGHTRAEVIYGFTRAQEFQNLCVQYGIIPFIHNG